MAFQKGHKINLGKKMSETTKRKISKIHKGRPGRQWSETSKAKVSKTMKEKGYKPPSPKGRKLTIKTKEKLRLTKLGEKNPSWQGGKSFESYSLDWTDDLRESIRKRDDYICQLCGVHQDELDGRFKKLDIHHIDYYKNNLNPDNLITLCKSCHTKTNHNRDYWIDYFE